MALTHAALEISAPGDTASTLDAIVRVALDSMPGIDAVGISMADARGRVESLAVTDEKVIELDRLQYETGQGPCLEAISTGRPVRAQNLAKETRWPQFIKVARGLGLRSQLGIPVQASGARQGGLNMYSITRDVIDDETEQMAELFAAHAAVALGNVERLENLNVALSSRKSIGIALGLVMARLDVDEDAAFAYLTRVSSTTETKLRAVAEALVEEHEAGVASRSSA